PLVDTNRLLHQVTDLLDIGLGPQPLALQASERVAPNDVVGVDAAHADHVTRDGDEWRRARRRRDARATGTTRAASASTALRNGPCVVVVPSQPAASTRRSPGTKLTDAGSKPRHNSSVSSRRRNAALGARFTTT